MGRSRLGADMCGRRRGAGEERRGTWSSQLGDVSSYLDLTCDVCVRVIGSLARKARVRIRVETAERLRYDVGVDIAVRVSDEKRWYLVVDRSGMCG
ncbi:hypothetical protein Tco_0873738 [Tanacetum coccineum]|uniref:HMA domain-containing protein n=1 Tax=Tanacetum coccineum TaxID=301880 RepID=A0ABQ5BMI7_9ASTR